LNAAWSDRRRSCGIDDREYACLVNGTPEHPSAIAGVARLTALMAGAIRAVFFTGAGVSTESGIPDFRSPGGVWTRYDPTQLTFDRYVVSAETRRLSWQMRREFFATVARPNRAHHAIAAFEAAGRSLGVITQNIDGLHVEAGSRAVIEIHGTARRIGCIGAAPRYSAPEGCGWSADTSWAFDRIDSGDDDPRCPSCDGLIKSATISFGQAMDETSLRRADDLLGQADAVIVVGSSLQVYPAAGLPAQAAARGIPCAIVNREPTPLDGEVAVVVHGSAGDVLPAAVSAALSRPSAPEAVT
jgi:NAD-dependent deacetylase